MNEQVEEQSSKANTALTTKTDTRTGNFDLSTDTGLVAAESFLKRFIASDKGGVKTVAEGIAIMARANELQLPFTSCCEHIHVINGKTGVDVHIIGALLSRAGITWEYVEDYIPLYNYTDGNLLYNEAQLPSYCVKCRNKKDAVAKLEADKDGYNVYVYPLDYYSDYNGNIYGGNQLNSGFAIAVNKAHAQKIAAEKKIPIYRIPAQPVDYSTKIKFTRRRVICGVPVVTEVIGRFSYIEAVNAGCFEKDTYKKYPRQMIRNRAFTYGARDIAPDIIFGVMETTELKIAMNANVNDSDFEDAQEI